MMQTLEFLTETPTMTPAPPFNLSSGLIDELLRGMRLSGVQYRRIQAGPSFGMGFEAKPGHAYFHFLAAGTATLRTDDGSLFELSAGNAVFISHGGAHALSSTADRPEAEPSADHEQCHMRGMRQSAQSATLSNGLAAVRVPTIC